VRWRRAFLSGRLFIQMGAIGVLLDWPIASSGGT
jgi:hypothetical protein